MRCLGFFEPATKTWGCLEEESTATLKVSLSELDVISAALERSHEEALFAKTLEIRRDFRTFLFENGGGR